MKPRIKIMLAGDNHLFLEGLHALFTTVEDIIVIGMALNGMEVLDTLLKKEVDVVVMDINIPGMNDSPLRNNITKQHPHVKTLVLNTYRDSDKIIKIIIGNINGCLSKNTEKAELLKAIYAIHSGSYYFSKEVQEKYINSHFLEKNDNDKNKVLSKREKEILEFIVAEYTTPQIAEKLFISEYTVNTHRKNLVSKLGVKNVAGLVKYAFLIGLI